MSNASTTADQGVDGQLYTRGDNSLLARLGDAVYLTGSRASTQYGNMVAADMADEIHGHGRVLLTGGAFGVEAAALRMALAIHAPMVIVLSSGLDRVYPPAHSNLFAAVEAAGGLLVSLWADGAPSRTRFLARSSWAAEQAGRTLIVEAAIRSTATQAVETAWAAGHRVGAVPGPITSAASLVTNRLIANGAYSLYDTKSVDEFLS